MTDNSERKQYKIRRDKYSKARGASMFLTISCATCQREILLYQKDGPGALLRMYLDKIHAPESLVTQLSSSLTLSEVPPLKCPACSALIAVPMVYEKENRLALRVIDGSLKKVRNKTGLFPS